MEPVLASLNQKYGASMVAEKIDISVRRNIGNRFNVQFVPHLLFIDARGNVFSQKTGFMEESDLLAEFERAGINVRGDRPVERPAEAVNITVRNRTGYMIYYLYVSPTTNDNWGQDLLGNDVLSSGSDFTVRGEAGVRYDFRAVDEDGDSYTRMNIDLNQGTADWWMEFTLDHID